jgi:LuxR family maltose regulon positive regulatory protein
MERQATAREESRASLRLTKLAPPRIPPTMVHRRRIEAMLTRGTALPVTLVSAVPGGGKTLAVAEWVGSGAAPGPVAWLNLDDTDNDPTTFWSDVLAALSKSGGVPRRNLIHDLSPNARFDSSQTDRIRAGLAELSQPVVLVLDDLHAVHDTRVLDALGRMLDHPPPYLRVVLITRADPPLRLHRLRVSGELAEIRTPELAFDPSEVDQLFGQHGLTLTGAHRTALLARTEGWAAGLRLAAMSLDQKNLDEGIAQFSGDEHAVADYLTGEVLDRQPDAVRDFLLRTSVAERLSGSLANALTGRTDGRRMLEQLASDNALVVELGEHREWFRYHPLLREMLLHRLELENLAVQAEVHARAAVWFAEHGEPVEGIRHAALAEDWDLVGSMALTVAVPVALSRDGPALVAALEPALARARLHPP